jgi:hypothetical protein
MVIFRHERNEEATIDQEPLRQDDPQWLAPFFLSCIVVLGKNKTTPIALSVAER